MEVWVLLKYHVLKFISVKCIIKGEIGHMELPFSLHSPWWSMDKEVGSQGFLISNHGNPFQITYILTLSFISNNLAGNKNVHQRIYMRLNTIWHADEGAVTLFDAPWQTKPQTVPVDHLQQVHNPQAQLTDPEVSTRHTLACIQSTILDCFFLATHLCSNSNIIWNINSMAKGITGASEAFLLCSRAQGLQGFYKFECRMAWNIVELQ